MDKSNLNTATAAGAALALVASALYVTKSGSASTFDNVLIGDIGGTNIRLQILRLYHSPTQYHLKKVVKGLTTYAPKEFVSFAECLKHFLADVSPEDKPKVGVVGMAGPVNGNVISITANIPHWKQTDGNKLASQFGFRSFQLINDFTAAGYGISVLNPENYVALGDSVKAPLLDGDRMTKVVIGPGTGLGHGLLVKEKQEDPYEIYGSEAGHADFSVVTDEDWELVKFARDFIENSDNVENLRAKGKVERMPVERLTAGPAVPLLYSFMKQKHPDLVPSIEKTKKFQDIESKDVVNGAVLEKDPLCLKAIDKFIEGFGKHTGNVALSTLPFGGIYLTGGVTKGIRDYLLEYPDKFLVSFRSKGSLEGFMARFRVMIVNSDIELGLLGAEEKARREMLRSK